MLQLHALLPPGLQLVPGQPPLAPLAQQTWPFWPHATQLPFRQVCEELQVVPQLPQWVGAACSFVQALLPPQWPLAQDVEPLQSCCPVGQPQEPPEHEAPVSQGWPQAPQLSGSVWRFVHRLPQSISDDRQEVTQVPELHVYPAEQGWLQPPQLSGSVWVFVQRPLHRLSLARQVVAHTPEPLQSLPAGQGWLQTPQFALSVWTFAQYAAPVAGVHRVPFWPQVLPHWPLTQASPLPHFVPQAPQLALSLWKLAQ